MIPKTIHYVWGESEKQSMLTSFCIQTWLQELEGYELKKWNESRVNITNRFAKECLDRKLWAYVADYLRIYVLYEQGGVYLDTDVHVLKPFDTLLDYPMFFGKRPNDEHPEPAVLGSEAGHPFLEKVLEFYEQEIWTRKVYTIPEIFSIILDRYFTLDQKTGLAYGLDSEIKVLAPEYFCPYGFDADYNDDGVTENTFSVHWWNMSWNESRELLFLKTKHLSGFKKLYEMQKFYYTRNIERPIKRILRGKKKS